MRRKTLNNMDGINTYIFDMDGTILNTLEDLTDSVNFVLRQFGLPPRALSEYRQFFGSGIRYAVSCAVPPGTPEELIDKMLPVFREHYNEHCLDKTRPYDGIPEVMKKLKERGCKIAIVSNKIDSAVQELNERFFAQYADAAIGERPGVARKPAPDMVMAALEKLGSSADEAVYVGDSEVDLKTAKNSGIPCIAVLWGFRSRDCLLENGAKLLAEKPEDILSI